MIGVGLVHLAGEPTLAEHREEKLRHSRIDLHELMSAGKRLERGECAHKWLWRLEATNVEPHRRPLDGVILRSDSCAADASLGSYRRVGPRSVVLIRSTRRRIALTAPEPDRPVIRAKPCLLVAEAALGQESEQRYRFEDRAEPEHFVLAERRDDPHDPREGLAPGSHVLPHIELDFAK